MCIAGRNCLVSEMCGLLILLIVFSVWFVEGDTNRRPNIVLIVADDLGWDDVSFHGSDTVLTPNIDLLAYTGVALTRYYSHCVCTPSRSALLTGKYAYTTGMQGYPLTNGEDRGLPVSEKVLPQYLKELGYATHLVGKWHVGRSRTEYLPTSRGFDTYYGHKGGYIDYYEYTNEEIWTMGPVNGFDLEKNHTVAWDVEGYITDVYTEAAKTIIESHYKEAPLFLMLAHNAPHSGNDGALLQAPLDEVRAHRYLENAERRIFAAMVKKLDDSVGEITQALLRSDMLENTIIIFISDNGGKTSGPTSSSLNYASNWPLRGLKYTPFEGGIRVVGLIWSSEMNAVYHEWNGYLHVVDWLPTILGAVNAEPPKGIDGVNQWQNIISNKNSSRTEFFEIYDDTESIVSGNYKLLTNNVNKEDSSHQGADMRSFSGQVPSYAETIKNSQTYSVLSSAGKSFDIKNIALRDQIRVKCDEIYMGQNMQNETLNCYNGTYCLFNIIEDPCETNEISQGNPDLVERMSEKLEEELKRVVSRSPVYRDPRALPSLFNNAWTVWADGLPKPTF